MEDRQPPLDLLGQDVDVKAALLALVVALAVSGCSGSDPSADKSARTTPSPTATTPAAPVQPVPQVGQCWRVGYQAATRPTDDGAPVPCSARHTAVTVFVGNLDTVADGHQLAVDSDTAQKQLAATCPGKLGPWIGGDEQTQRLSRFTAIWFAPTVKDGDAGARWFRCDAVAVRKYGKLAKLPGDAKGILGRADALKQFGTCGTSAPSESGFQRLACSEPHTWEAATVFDLPRDAAYLGKDAQSQADDACKTEAQQRASDPLVYKWSFEWPTQQEWSDGRRWGLCWVPSTGS